MTQKRESENLESWSVQQRCHWERFFQTRGFGIESEDAVQELYVRLLARARVVSIRCLDSFARGVAANMVREHTRRKRYLTLGDNYDQIIDERAPDRWLSEKPTESMTAAEASARYRRRKCESWRAHCPECGQKSMRWVSNRGMVSVGCEACGAPPLFLAQGEIAEQFSAASPLTTIRRFQRFARQRVRFHDGKPMSRCPKCGNQGRARVGLTHGIAFDCPTCPFAFHLSPLELALSLPELSESWAAGTPMRALRADTGVLTGFQMGDAGRIRSLRYCPTIMLPVQVGEGSGALDPQD